MVLDVSRASTVRNVLRTLMTKKLLMQFSWSGGRVKKEKKKLCLKSSQKLYLSISSKFVVVTSVLQFKLIVDQIFCPWQFISYQVRIASTSNVGLFL